MDSTFTRLASEQCEVAFKTKRACKPGSRPMTQFLPDCVEDACLNGWSNSITTVGPLFALRNVRCCIRSGTCDCGAC
jgi:hypothetical protein